MSVNKSALNKSVSPFEDMVLVDDINDILGVDKTESDPLNLNLKGKDDLLEIIDSIVYEVAESKAAMIVNSGLDTVVKYLNDNGLSTQEIVEIAELRRGSQ